MRSGIARITILLLLVAVAAVAAFIARDDAQRSGVLDASSRETDAALDRVAADVARIAAAQGGYVAPGQPDEPWLTQATTSLTQLTMDIDAMQARVRSVGAANRLDEISEHAATLADADRRAREQLKFGDDLSAARVLFGDGHESTMSILTAVDALREAEVTAVGGTRRQLDLRTWLAIGAAAGVWLIGTLLLVRVPRPSANQPVAETLSILPAEPIRPREPAVTDIAAVDIAAAADLCTSLSRISTTAALTELLDRAAKILDAAGLIVWMGAGDDLFPVTAHGYEARVIDRLGSIGRSSSNATAAAWRAGETRTVAGDATSPGAIVAPMFGPSGCVGVLAAEVRHGRETDATTRAVTQLIAAQLATVLAGAAPQTDQRAAG